MVGGAKEKKNLVLEPHNSVCLRFCLEPEIKRMGIVDLL